MKYFGGSELSALLLATGFPLAYGTVDLAMSYKINPVSAIVLLGILGSSIPPFFGGSPRLLLLRESLFTGMFGFSCFISLLLPRPLMFYFGRHFRAGADPQKRVRFDAAWELPRIRFAHRLITVVWGAMLLGEFGLKVILINYASTASVLLVSPAVLRGLTIATVIWTFRYAKTVRTFIPPPSGP